MRDFTDDLSALGKRLDDAGHYLGVDALRTRLAQLEAELSRPDLALRAYLDYKEFHKSGADTLFQIARCYEAMGDPGNAAKFYTAVTAYEEHPRHWDAKEALKRLGKA